MPDLAREPDVKARLLFLLALRVEIPHFWATLSQTWQAGTPEALLWWSGKWSVVDEWLLEVVRDTLEYWTSDPNSPDARLDTGYKWFLYRAPYMQEQRPFQFVLQDPRPLQRGPISSGLDPRLAQVLPVGKRMTEAQRELQAVLDASECEPIEDFKSRARNTFERQLREYGEQFERRLSFDREPESMKHSIWTAHRFVGAGYMQIAEKWPGLNRGISKDPEQPDKTVNVAVKRFAERIGLTLPKPR